MAWVSQVQSFGIGLTRGSSCTLVPVNENLPDVAPGCGSPSIMTVHLLLLLFGPAVHSSAFSSFTRLGCAHIWLWSAYIPNIQTRAPNWLGTASHLDHSLCIWLQYVRHDLLWRSRSMQHATALSTIMPEHSCVGFSERSQVCFLIYSAILRGAIVCLNYANYVTKPVMQSFRPCPMSLQCREFFYCLIVILLCSAMENAESKPHVQ